MAVKRLAEPGLAGPRDAAAADQADVEGGAAGVGDDRRHRGRVAPRL